MNIDEEITANADESRKTLDDLAGELLAEARYKKSQALPLPSGEHEMNFRRKRKVANKQRGIFVTDLSKRETYFVPDRDAKPYVDKMPLDDQIKYDEFDFENNIFEIEIDSDGVAEIVTKEYAFDPFA